jgi:hypothetical protein
VKKIKQKIKFEIKNRGSSENKKKLSQKIERIQNLLTETQKKLKEL